MSFPGRRSASEDLSSRSNVVTNSPMSPMKRLEGLSTTRSPVDNILCSHISPQGDIFEDTTSFAEPTSVSRVDNETNMGKAGISPVPSSKSSPTVSFFGSSTKASPDVGRSDDEVGSEGVF